MMFVILLNMIKYELQSQFKYPNRSGYLLQKCLQKWIIKGNDKKRMVEYKAL